MRVPYWGPNNVGNANFPWAPNNNPYEGTSTLTGWGQTNPSPNESPNFPSKMKVVNLPLMSNAYCRAYHNVDDGRICAGGINGQNSCRGDFGGPLVWPNNGWSTLIGLSSYGPMTIPTKEHQH
ncbi:chymotrypsinogen B2-like protein [Leptotrombidium deliense]|uniref:Chymotrypsinogen B2-like protein n=1 Tax=Leptotrombidium deliense TaxID=299467 RepID=A0A443RTR4_9ACAR|nr:chymotrypsinogen B2-like protein [Leptotrombidium deliense]